MTKWLIVALIFFAIMSVIAFIFYGNDKKKAEKKVWRTKEAVLLGLGFFGGSVGALLGMKTFRHKTKHYYFWAINFLGLIWQVALVVYLIMQII